MIPDDDTFQILFDRFEYLHRLIVAEAFLERENNHIPISDGIFVWRRRSDDLGNVFSYFDKEAEMKGEKWPLLKSGLFGASLERFHKAKKAIDPTLQRAWMAYIH